MGRRLPLVTVILGLLALVLGALLTLTDSQVSAAKTGPNILPEQTQSDDQPPKASNAYCLLCHAQPDRVWTLPSGEKLSLTIDPSILAKSVHGDANKKGALACADCHVNHRFPHPVDTSQTVRQFTLERYATCRTCHEDEYTRSQDSVHGAALRSGRLEAAVCVDCHGSHDIQSPAQPRQRISLTCGKCHGAIFDQYRNSVHGKALLAEDNPDVPTCIDCHGVHNIQNPTSALFRVRSPDLCLRCHANTDLMTKYNISTNIHDSYLTDFHGETVALFEQLDPKIATNKAVCYDCHGTHNIQKVTNGNAAPIRENLLTTCQQCHPNATNNFPAAWIGHYPATQEEHPVLYAANRLYGVLTPAVVGLIGFSIISDVYRRVRRRRNDAEGA
jgi:predicted CXXCH cytochrome family protein